MVITKTQKTILGLLALWSPIYMVIFNIVLFTMFRDMQATPHTEGPSGDFFTMFAILFVFHMFTILSLLGQMVFYIWHCLTQNPEFQENSSLKVLWALMIFMLGIVAMPVYWFLYIKVEPPSLQIT